MPMRVAPEVVSRPAAVTASTLRDAAERYSPDPLDRASPSFQPVPPVPWIYPPAQYELAVLHQVVRDGFAANRFVHYAANFGDVTCVGEFRRALTGRESEIAVSCTGSVTAYVDGAPLPVPTMDEGRLSLQVPAGHRQILLIVECSHVGPAAVSATGAGAFEDDAPWESVDEFGVWQPAVERPGLADMPPHLLSESTVDIPVEEHGSAFSLEAPVLGRPIIRSATRPRISSGESLAEALAGFGRSETRHDLVEISDGTWTSVHELGFQHLVVRDSQRAEVMVRAAAHPAHRRGVYLCSDSTLNEIWGTSAYTLRACMHRLLLDGIKRDRMPWVGDQALTTLSNAYAFGDGAIVRDGLVALGRPRHGYVNGISDYSLWWLINNAAYLLYFGDETHATREAENLHRFVEHLASYTDTRGVFRPKEEADRFEDASAGSIFIDWGVMVDPNRVSTALQVLWFWALRSAVHVLRTAEHPGADRWERLGRRVRRTLEREAWNEEAGNWLEYLGDGSAVSPHANMLAVLSGLSSEAETPGIRHALVAMERAGTPFMTSFAIRALAQVGEPSAALARIRSLWGGMLEAGAKTFWEEFDAPGEERYAMYGRPFGKSLCHAWSAGPAALLPEIVLGVRPLGAGWSRFTVDPSLCDLDWAAAVVPAPGGDIVVMTDEDGTIVDVPEGSVLELPTGDVRGPCRVRLDADMRTI